MRLTLLIPHLFAFADETGVPAALTRLARARREARPGDWLDARLCRLFGLTNQPVAALTHALDCGENGGSWLRADPVHISMQQSSARLVDASALQIGQDEADTVVAHLNRLFEDEGLRWIAPRPERWYVGLDRTPRADFVPLPLALGREVPTLAVDGEEGRLWRRRLTEIQMSLHGLPLNQRREEAGLPPINHLWLWGEGDFSGADTQNRRFWGDTPTLQALAAAAGTTAQAPALTFERWRQRADGGEHVVVLDSLSPPAWAAAPAAWREELDRLTRDWLDPALRAGGLELVIEAFEPEGAALYRWRSADRFKFWRRTHVGY